MTNSLRRTPVLRVPLCLLCSCLIVAACGEGPREGEIVISASDLDSLGTGPDGDSIPFTTDTLPGDTIPAVPDSLSFPPDSLPGDSVISPSDTLSADTVSSDSLPPDSASTSVCPWTRLALEINGSIYGSLAGLTEEPDIVGAHIVRCMCWDVDPWRGVNAGDSLYLLLGETGRENRVVALRYVPRSGTANAPFSVYSFRMTGDNFPSHYYADGREVMKLLNTMPVGTFEEMTSPYGEPRGDHTHAGVDFKAPEGTPVRTCRGGTVVRINWNREYNGNCVEVDIGAGYSEIFLHLQSISDGIAVGSVIARGEVIGAVGNTGVTSTAPHIHYQINDERDNPIDPYIFFGSHGRSLPQGDMAAFAAFRDSCDRWLGSRPL